MFNHVCENFRRATEATVQMQQEMFKTWVNLWPCTPANSTLWGEQMQQFQKKWAEALGEMVKKQHEVVGVQFKAGLQDLEKVFKIAESKTPEDLRSQCIELWKKCFDDMQKVYEAQFRGFQFVTDKWAEFTMKSAK